MSKAFAIPVRRIRTDCDGIQTVSRSRRHSAVAENISIGLWCW